jgi:heptosyltransferase-1
VRLLVVKMSSLGDVVHALPAVTDACAHGAEVDWVVEEAFADIPALHPGVRNVWPIAWRRWRKDLRGSSSEMRQFFTHIRQQRYDVIIDAQGLIKSAAVSLLAKAAKGAKAARQGFSHSVAREPWAAFAYAKGHAIVRRQHAIDRQRQLFAATLGYDLPAAADSEDSGLAQSRSLSKHVVLLHGTTWATKHWPEAMWQNLAEQVQADGFEAVVTWGNEQERQRAKVIAAASGATLQDRLPLHELTTLLAEASAVVGVDSGLCHLSAALGTPTLGLYGPTDGQLTGCRGRRAQYVQAGTPCSPCMQDRCRAYRGEPQHWQGTAVEPACFASMPPAHVWQLTRALMAGA